MCTHSYIIPEVQKEKHGSTNALSMFFSISKSLLHFLTIWKTNLVPYRIPVVDIRGEEIDTDKAAEDDEDTLTFGDSSSDDSSGVEYDIYDFYSLYDTNSDDNAVNSRKKRR